MLLYRILGIILTIFYAIDLLRDKLTLNSISCLIIAGFCGIMIELIKLRK